MIAVRTELAISLQIASRNQVNLLWTNLPEPEPVILG
jgi:hypothetical protein